MDSTSIPASSARDFVRTGLVITVVGYALVLLFTATYWSWLGIV